MIKYNKSFQGTFESYDLSHQDLKTDFSMMMVTMMMMMMMMPMMPMMIMMMMFDDFCPKSLSC